MNKKSFIDYISQKRLGIPIGLPKLNKNIHGISQGMYYLIGGGSNSGKTTFVDYCFLLQALASNRPVKIFYYSYEISEYRKYAKMIAYLLYINDNIELGDMDILNATDVDITPYMPKIKEYYNEFYKTIKDKVIFSFNPSNPTQIYKDLRGYAERNGKFIKHKITNNEGEEIVIGEEYIANNPDELVLVIQDHK